MGPKRPTALLCFADVIVRVYSAPPENFGIDVPGDLSIVGYDDAPFAATQHAAVDDGSSGHRRQGPNRGRIAHTVDRCRSVRGEVGADPRSVLPTHLVVRESTEPVRSPTC